MAWLKPRCDKAEKEEDVESLRPLRPLLPSTRILRFGTALPSPHKLSTALLFLLLPLFVLSSYIYLHPSPQLAKSPLATSPNFAGLDVESAALPFSPSTSLPSLLSALDTRLSAAGFTPTTFSCALSAADTRRFDHLRTRGPTLIALNLFNNELVLPSLSRTILSLADFLGAEKVAVSIYENGSEDRTKVGLAHLAAALSVAGVKHTILSSSTRTDWTAVDRIEQLAAFRNIVTESARTSDVAYETLLFINDVFLCSRDALELLHQRVVQDASATCGLDFVAKKGLHRGGLAVFYDNWVTRSISGRTLRPRMDLLRAYRNGIQQLFSYRGEEESRDRFEAGLPLPVYSCWNGMITLDARPFRGISLAGEAVEPLLFRSGDAERGECTASECQIMAKDFWRRGFARFVLVPTVRVTYEQELYHSPELVELASRASNRDVQSVEERIDWSRVSVPEDVTCWRWRKGLHVDFWFMAELEAPM